MSNKWVWIWKYAIVIMAVLIIGAVLGNLGLFKSTTLGSPRITAGSLAQFISHAGGLILLWLLGQRVANQVTSNGGAQARLASSVLALTTLVVASSAYAVLMQFAGPFIGSSLKPFINWAFILGILAAAGWFVSALYKDAEALMEAIGSGKKQNHQTVQP